MTRLSRVQRHNRFTVCDGEMTRPEVARDLGKSFVGAEAALSELAV